MPEGKIAICDDEKEILRYLKKILQATGYSVDTFNDGGSLIRQFEADSNYLPDLLILDIQLLDMNGVELLKFAREKRADMPVIMMTAYGSIQTAIETIKLGAYDYITKPFPIEKLLGLLEKALEREVLRKENRQLKDELLRSSEPRELIYRSEKYGKVYEMTLQVASSEANILIQGESGTGKELIAHAIHKNSPRCGKRYLSINCAALTDSLLESQLFGHLKGAFTGATVQQKGILEAADGGTLFLDEIGDMSLVMQAKVLRVIQEREFIPVGGTAAKSVDIRLIAATNKKLEEEVKVGNFRQDLFYRLNVITIETPPLRERIEDIEPLTYYFMDRFSIKMKKRVSKITSEALKKLTEYYWPGNIRELENIIERGVILASNDCITPEILPTRLINSITAQTPNNVDETLEAVEKIHIANVLKKNGYHKTKTAEILGITRKTLNSKIAEYAIPIPNNSF